jgi:hypothetical protein
MNRIHHMRSKFYTDDFFCPMPSLEDDAMPFANLVRARKPELITVAFDPEGACVCVFTLFLYVCLSLFLSLLSCVNTNPLLAHNYYYS